MGPVMERRTRRDSGFTLMEMLIVVAIIGIIAGIAAVQLRQTPLKAKEATLKEDLFTLRDVIDQYFADKGKYPDSLQSWSRTATCDASRSIRLPGPTRPGRSTMPRPPTRIPTRRPA